MPECVESTATEHAERLCLISKLPKMGKRGIFPLWHAPWSNVMSQTLKLDSLEMLPRTPASDVKKLGWRGVMKAIRSSGKVVVTNHNEPEAVILSAEEYGTIQRALQEAGAGGDPVLDVLRRQFDARLASLQSADAGERLRDIMRRPAKLGGQVKAGASH